MASARGIAATVPADSSICPSDILDAANDILDKSANLITAAKTAVDDPENPNSRAQLTQVILVFHTAVSLYCVVPLLIEVSHMDCIFIVLFNVMSSSLPYVVSRVF